MERRVVVAMSGGVDSSVAAAILKRNGYDVVGVTMQVWPESLPAAGADSGCCSLAAVEDARRCADVLGIPHYVLNFRDEFRRCVIDYFCDEYARGRTPNPCVACNTRVKFDTLARKAAELGADLMATGHYARIERDPRTGRLLLRKGIDPAKDQSYVLYGLKQWQMSRLLFPVGGLEKRETRRIAAELGLPVAAKPDSQEICFVVDGDYRAFLEWARPGSAGPGPIYSSAGELLGEHPGIPFFTVGQRRGIGVASDRPLYVLEIDPARNALVVGPEEELYADGLAAEDVNLIAVESLDGPARLGVKVRYRAEEAPALVRTTPGEGALSAEVEFDEPQRAVSPGQAVVFYDGDVVVGGGTISRALTGRRPGPCAGRGAGPFPAPR